MVTDAQLAAIMFGGDGHLRRWSEEQWQAISAPVQPHLVTAGAGSGKTTVMAARIVWLVANGDIEPGSVLGLTFTNKAAREFNERVEHALRRLWGGRHAELPHTLPAISTYHSFAQTFLAMHGLRLGYEPGAELLDEASRAQLAMRVLQRTRQPLAHVSMSLTTTAGQILDVDNLLSERLIEPAAFAASAQAELQRVATSTASNDYVRTLERVSRQRIELAALVEEFRQAKAESFVVDFADQMRTAAAAAVRLRESDVQAIEAIRQQHRVVLLDEYQDTSVAQRTMLQALFGDGHPVMAVGDPCQAIYGWRGASVFNMDCFRDDFPTASGEQASRSTLSIVRRCAPRILDVANQVSEPLRSEHPDVVTLKAPDGETRTGRFIVAFHEEFAQETQWLVEQAKAAVAEAGSSEKVAILCRLNRDVQRMARALDVEGVPYQVTTVGSLLQRPEVADVRALLDLLHDPAANVSCLRLLTGSRWNIGLRDLAALGAHSRHLAGWSQLPADATLEQRLDEAVAGVDESDVPSLMEAIDDLIGTRAAAASVLSADALTRLAEFSAQVRSLRRHAGEPLSDLVRRVIDVSGVGLEVMLAPEPLRTTKIAALDALTSAASDFVSVEGESSLPAFLTWLADAEHTGKEPMLEDPGQSTGVRLMTVHASKGLEFDIVILPNLSSDIFPSKKGRFLWTRRATALPSCLLEERESSQRFPDYPDYPKGPTATSHKKFAQRTRALDDLDERRLMYVAVTRAKTLVIASGHQWTEGNANAREPSPYLEVMRAHVEAGNPGVVDVWAAPPAANKRAIDPAAQSQQWPAPASPQTRERLLRAAEMVERAQRGDNGRPDGADDALTQVERAQVEAWDRAISMLAAESAAESSHERHVRLVGSITTSDVMRIAADRDGFARDLARPMPRITTLAARRGTDFHAWVEQRHRPDLGLVSPADVDGVDPTWRPDPDVQELVAAFESGQFAQRAPWGVEVPFAMVIEGVPVRGRIDAIFENPDGKWLVVDWKTGTREAADENQLRVYRHAWAQVAGVAAADVSAGFYFVRTDTLVMLDEPPADLGELLRSE